MADDEAAHSFGLVLPFVAVESKGGPFADDAYVAGYEAGRMDCYLEHAVVPFAMPVHDENVAQLDLIAMRHGWTMTTEDSGDGWVHADFTKAVADV